MFSLGNHDMEHQRLIRQLRFYPLPVTALPTPTAAITGQRVTYNNLDYYCDGTRWVTVQLFPLAVTLRADNTLVNNGLTATRASVQVGSHPDNVSDIYITTIMTTVNNSSAQSGVNFWTISYRFRDTTTATSTTYTADTKLFTTGSRINGVPITVNAVMTRANFYDVLQDFTLTAAGGTLFFEPATIWYRLIGA